MSTTWTWLGDHLAVDFANTVRRGGDGTLCELIGTPAHFASWLAAEPAILPSVTLTETDLTALRALRDAAGRLQRAAIAGGRFEADDVDLINLTVREGGVHRLLGPSPRMSRHDGIGKGYDVLAGLLAAAVVDLLAREDLANIAECTAPGCGQIFHRARPNQLWCSPGCGNRARVDRHRHRRTAPPTPPTPAARSATPSSRSHPSTQATTGRTKESS